MKGSLKNLKKIMVSHRIRMLSLGKPKQKNKDSITKRICYNTEK